MKSAAPAPDFCQSLEKGRFIIHIAFKTQYDRPDPVIAAGDMDLIVSEDLASPGKRGSLRAYSLPGHLAEAFGAFIPERA